MAFRTKKCIFYHIPKTGGTWVRKVLSHSPHYKRINNWSAKHPLGLIRNHKTPTMTKHLVDNYDDYFTFAFVREPVSWYRSFWSQRKDQGIKKHLKGWFFPLNDCWRESYSDTLKSILDKYPDGFLTSVYKEYLGENGDSLDFVGRQENLIDDLTRALSKAGEYIEKDFMEVSPKNVSTYSGLEVDVDIEKKIREVEGWIFRKFYNRNEENHVSS